MFRKLTYLTSTGQGWSIDSDKKMKINIPFLFVLYFSLKSLSYSIIYKYII